MNALRILFLVIVLLLIPFVSMSAADELSISVTPYGYIKFDAAYETGRSSHGNITFWASDPGESGGLFHATANQTRLGLRISAGKIGTFTVRGNLEVDFYGGGAENKAYNYMRHAYIELKNDRWSFIAGQYWDIINPLNPFTLNYPVLWGGGNIGYRRPQLSVHHRLSAGRSLFTLQAGIFRTISGDLDNDGIDDGVASGIPTFQGRIAGKFPFSDEAFIQIGVSGHTGRSEGAESYKSDSINLDLTLGLSKRITLLGEFFKGRNMSPFLGGILQGVNGVMKKEIDTTGFYATLQAGLTSRLKLNAGFGQDKPDVETLSPGNRSLNRVFFSNLVYAFNKGFSAGFEVLHAATDYFEAGSQKTLRFQHSWMLNF